MIYVNIILASFSWFKVARNNIIESNSILLSITMYNLAGGYHVSDVPTPSIWSSPCAHHKSMWGSGVTPSLILNLELAKVSGQPQAPNHFTTVEKSLFPALQKPDLLT